MTDDSDNPLVFLGIPTWFAKEQLQRGEPGLVAIKDLAATLHKRMAMRLYHPDTGATPDDARYAELSGLVAILDDLEVVELYAQDMLDDGSLDGAEVRERLASLARKEARRLRAVTAMLPLVDPFALLQTAEPTQLVFGMPGDMGFIDNYKQTFLLDVQPGRPQALRLALQGRGVVFSVSDSLRYEAGTWHVEYLDAVLTPLGSDEFDLGPIEPIQRRHTFSDFVSHGSVRLVGGIPWQLMAKGVPELSLFPKKSIAAIESTADVLPASGVGWRPPERADWLGLIRPQLGMGDFGVIATGSGDSLRLALVGRLLASRPLNN